MLPKERTHLSTLGIRMPWEVFLEDEHFRDEEQLPPKGPFHKLAQKQLAEYVDVTGTEVNGYYNYLHDDTPGKPNWAELSAEDKAGYCPLSPDWGVLGSAFEDGLWELVKSFMVTAVETEESHIKKEMKTERVSPKVGMKGGKAEASTAVCIHRISIRHMSKRTQSPEQRRNSSTASSPFVW